ncbi:uncharacterized protein LOC128198259 [Bicyclus anynana]|uniref:Uncharacterized protein LOC128198259 n=1 Tax=Bicyclus anynana TaxID=110368 RepID=A0ABM3LHI7_BICAN|nr:uncharacterized protein LOC128198259 [Bicyclus anynana]XP_052738539.1 uncharacterized protein LOC128198259 [Bicyclus anynana]XP_052738540.1 uncharacterized protein LOC128198259 [Bicyclus anynana]
MGGPHSSKSRWTLGSQGAGMATPHRKVQCDPSLGGPRISSGLQGAAGCWRLEIVVLGGPCKRPMSSSGRLWADKNPGTDIKMWQTLTISQRTLLVKATQYTPVPSVNARWPLLVRPPSNDYYLLDRW